MGRVLENTNHLDTFQACLAGGLDGAINLAKVQRLVRVVRPLLGQLKIMPGLGAAQNNFHRWLPAPIASGGQVLSE